MKISWGVFSFFKKSWYPDQIKQNVLGWDSSSNIFFFLNPPWWLQGAKLRPMDLGRLDYCQNRRGLRWKLWGRWAVMGWMETRKSVKQRYTCCEAREGPEKRISSGCLYSDLNAANYQKLKIQSNWRNSHTDTLFPWITSGVIFRLSLAVYTHTGLRARAGRRLPGFLYRLHS